MRLEKIKLAGFKSFVDPTTLVLPGRLIGIVGPNGCGKSNLIDAVRFVIGESSARHLRGSAMSDVIFNGSSGRAPVALASVELIFDNADGRAGGEFARYAQISVKRQVSREGQSHYYLNGSRCRRRDIMDLFLGTGLGPRSYAIIEQGMVSRFIEARPEELRLFIEEAAGLSKYKERRRETEIKLEHTRANLERVADLRGELKAQVGRLARQAKKAERFRELERQIRTCRAQLLAIQWREADDAYRRRQAEVGERERHHHTLEAQLREAEQASGQARARVETLERQLQRLQARLYELNADISRCDQVVKHAEKTREQRRQTLAEWRRELERTRSALQQDREQLEALQRQQRQLEADLADIRRRAETDAEAQRRCESHWQEVRRQFGRHRDRLRSLEEGVRLQKAEIGHRQGRLDDLQRRSERLEAQQAELAGERDGSDPGEAERRLHQARERNRSLQKQLQEAADAGGRLRRRLQERQQRLQGLEGEIHRLQGEIAALETLQRHALGKDREVVRRWLARHGWENLPRLGEVLEVADGWEKAVEAVLGPWLEALCVDELPASPGTPPQPLAFIGPARETAASPDSLADRVHSDRAVTALLEHCRCADSLATALARRDRLAPHECWITPAGDRVGRDWLHLAASRQEGDPGVLERQKILQELQTCLQRLQQEHRETRTALRESRDELAAAERELERLRAREREDNATLARLQAEWQAARQRHQEIRRRLERLEQECREAAAERRRLEETLRADREKLAKLRRQAEAAAEELTRLENCLEAARRDAERAAATARHSREQLTRLETALEHTRRSVALLESQLQRGHQRCRELEERLVQAEAEQNASEAPLRQAQEELEALLARRPGLEAELAQTRDRLDQAAEELRHHETLRRQRESEHQHSREDLEQARLQAEAARVRFDTARQQAAAAGIDLAQVLETLPDDAHPGRWQERLERLEREQARLGDVNLAAIEEHRLHSERLRFLDKQCQDLENALAMLEKAIRTIDRETRTRFRETFEAVNGHFRQRFPALFGGGEAGLELAGADPLEAGVRIVARPPGKRNSSIHLLSGGEKALTAIALVFSFFELNPAPFCILDEVDAPLDDTNVGRFCRLLQSMAQRVQFLFVTHNKITMEIADQLIGVTMGEPGVSRIVAVDLQQAAEMAA